jgi:hypothetical protein
MIFEPVLITPHMILDECLSFTAFAAIQKGKGSRMLLGPLLIFLHMIEPRRPTLLATRDLITVDCHGSFGVYPFFYVVDKSIKVLLKRKNASDASTCLDSHRRFHQTSVRPFGATDGSFFCTIASVAIHHEVKVEQEKGLQQVSHVHTVMYLYEMTCQLITPWPI